MLWVSPRTGAACLVHLYVCSPYHRWAYRWLWKHEFFTCSMAKGCRFICNFDLCNLVPVWESASLCKTPVLHLGRWHHLKLTPSCDNGRTQIKAETLSGRTSSPIELCAVWYQDLCFPHLSSAACLTCLSWPLPPLTPPITLVPTRVCTRIELALDSA